MPTKPLSRRKHAKVLDLAAAGHPMRLVAKKAGVGFGTAVAFSKKPLPNSDGGGAELPESWAEEYPPFILDGVSRVLILNDVHIPFQVNAAVEAAVEYGQREAVDCVLLNGDIFDFHRVSKYPHDGTSLTYREEIEYGRQFLSYLRGRLPKARLVFRDGNHEERLEKYILGRAEALFGIEDCTFPSLLRFPSFGVERVADQRLIHLGKLRVIHGHEYGGNVSAPVNAARWLMSKAKRSAAMGHLHQTSEQPETDIDGEIRACWSIGCLSSLKPKYRRYSTSWNHGAAIVFVSKDGSFEMHNRRIVNGRVV